MRAIAADQAWWHPGNMTGPEEDLLAWVCPYPLPLDASRVPEHLRQNPLIQHLLTVSPEQEAMFDALARQDASSDGETVALLLAEPR